MECREIVERHIAGLKEEFRCISTERRLRIITPYLYPDNDLIEIFVEDLGKGRVKITDLGEAFRHLHSQGFDVFASSKRKFLAETIASRVNVEMSGGKLIRIVTVDEISEAIFDIITASRGIADLIYTSRTYEPGTFFDEVKGEVLNSKKTYLQTLSPRNVLRIKGKVDATVRMWLDFNAQFKKLSLLNDIDFQWKEPDVNILSRVSIVQFWSKKDELVSILKD